MKKIISILVVICLVAATVAPSAFAYDDDTVGTKIPTIYVGGQGESIYDKDGNKIYPLNISTDNILKALKNSLPYYGKALLFNDWYDFLDKLYEAGMEILSPIALDKNGEASDGSYPDFKWKKEDLDGEKVNGLYPLERYYFLYDWRLSPIDNAKILHEYVEDVLEVTGAKKVEMIGRCLGAAIAESYMYLYDGQYVDSYLQYASGAQGVMMISNCFSGTLGLYPDAIERFILDNQKLNLEGDVYTLVSSIVAILNRTHALDFLCNKFNKTYNDIYMDIIPRLIGETFGTMPGYWAMVEDDCYETAKQVCLYSRGYTDSSKLVKKIDEYHYNVQTNIGNLLKRMETEKGITISNITKYGRTTHFFLRDGNQLGDEAVKVSNSAYGATTSTIKGILSPEYLLDCFINDNTKYISPDLKIDASTCLYPDRTYFVKNLIHSDFPDIFNPFIVTILDNNDMTIDTYPEYPQFMVYNEEDENETLSPMTVVNMFTDKALYTTIGISSVKLVASVFGLIKNSLAK